MSHSYRINSFKDLSDIKNLKSDALNSIEERLTLASNGKEFLFTDLQLKAINQQGFWSTDDGSNSHIIIKGATSSGKTLVSELAVLDAIRNGNKSIVLVPLKAMVRERRDLFRKDFAKTGTTEIYASSSDFLDHDGDIINGQYTVAVIVYEKFFAMLAQSSGNMLNGCSLIIVDELQMLSNEGRGPKLEVSLQKVLHENGVNDRFIRIMCLTTCDCSISNISRWLSTTNKRDPIIIESDKRPVGLEEYVICANGDWRMKHITGERDEPKVCALEQTGSIEVPGYTEEEGTGRRGNSEKWKRDLLRALLLVIREDQPDAKVLVFVNGRNKAKVIAEYISNQDGLTTFVPLADEITQELDSYDNDEYQSSLKNELLPRKIGFHNAAMSTALREFIEDKFNEKDTLSIVTATETLTIGMNMPVDVMILYDMSVPRNYNKSVNLTSQEYKNFAGRAGRLGISNRVGRSYIFARDETRMNEYWNNYVNCSSSEITSALTHASVERQAPYYLSLLEDNGVYRDISKGFSLEDLKKLHDESFSKICGGVQLDMEEMVHKFLQVDLCYEVDSTEDDIFDDEIPNRYRLTAFGRLMAPYALSLQSCNMIKRVFLSGGYTRIKDRETGQLKWREKLKDGNGGLPESVSENEIENDKYLLDILYAICRTPEIVNLSQLKLPDETNPDKSRIALNRIDEQLRKMVAKDEENNALCDLWIQSPLSLFIEGVVQDERVQKEPLMRAIILWYWTKGATIAEIKRKTGFDSFTTIVSGDVARLAEAVSYQIEAIYKCQGGYKGKSQFRERALTPLYDLSTRVKYGMPRNLVIIANRQIHGLDRKTILKIGKVAKAGGYDTPASFIKNAPFEEIISVINEKIRKELLGSIAEPYLRDAFDTLLEELNIKQRIISDYERQGLEELYVLKSSSDDSNNKLKALSNLFLTDDLIASGETYAYKRFYSSDIKIDKIRDDIIRLRIRNERNHYSYLISLFNGSISSMKAFNNFVNDEVEARSIVLFLSESSMKKHISQESYDNWEFINIDEGTGAKSVIVSRISTTMSISTFSQLIAQDIAISDSKAITLATILNDLTGVFLFSGLKSLYKLLENYDIGTNISRSSKDNKQCKYRILYDRRISLENTFLDSLINYLDSINLSYRFLTWGNALEKESFDETSDNTILFVSNTALENSRYLRQFCVRAKKSRYKNTTVLFNNRNQYNNWDNSEKGYMHYYIMSKSNNDFSSIFDSEDCLESHPNYVIGISYAHEKNGTFERKAVKQLKEIVKQLNELYGESSILFDGNASCVGLFDGQGAKEQTLQLYRQCRYYIILDDNFYDISDGCKKEKDIIFDETKNNKNKKLLFLHPTEDQHISGFDESTDYTTPLYYNLDNTNKIIEIISKQVYELLR